MHKIGELQGRFQNRQPLVLNIPRGRKEWHVDACPLHRALECLKQGRHDQPKTGHWNAPLEQRGSPARLIAVTIWRGKKKSNFQASLGAK